MSIKATEQIVYPIIIFAANFENLKNESKYRIEKLGSDGCNN